MRLTTDLGWGNPSSTHTRNPRLQPTTKQKASAVVLCLFIGMRDTGGLSIIKRSGHVSP